MATSTYGHAPSSIPAHGYAPPPAAPAGTFPPGTLLTVGAHKVTIERYLSEGGFAHVYLVRLSRPFNGLDVAVLKRVAVPDKEALANMRTEVETMKRLKGHRHIVTYIDSHASHLKGGGYEVFLLMEYCSGGGLIDFMNTRLQNRLTEPEVLAIINDIAEGVACMHYLQPPLLHRDLKVENVLIAQNHRFVLCDFGSASPVKKAANLAECRALEEDIQKHTTLQYRSPEMIDVYKMIPIDEKSDIWALGVLLYKLCYYTTPFEEKGQLAIMNASFKFPSYPVFSDRMKSLIASMLREVAHTRPNIYQVLREICSMRGKEVPIKDIYHGRTTQVKSAERPIPVPQPAPSIVTYQAPLPAVQPVIPDIVPMRRGRPTKPSQSGMPASSQSRGVSSDPFAALDSQTLLLPTQDELSARFPSVEQFSLLHDSGNKFDFKEFNPDSPTAFPPLASQPAVAPVKDLNTRVIERLADDAFVKPSAAMQKTPTVEPKPKEFREERQPVSQPVLYQPQPQKPSVVSTGTMTSPPHSPSPSPDRLNIRVPEALSRPHSRPQSRSLDHLRNHTTISTLSSASTASTKPQRPAYLETHRSNTQVSPRAISSSRPSLESHRPASSTDLFNPNANRPKTTSAKGRPSSVYVESNLDFLRDLDSSPTREKETTPPTTSNLLIPNHVLQDLTGQSITSQRSDHIESNVEFLRVMESEADLAKEKSKLDKRLSSGSFVGKHVKRSSMPSISLSNTKTLLAGKFGDAFRRFEGNSSDHHPHRTPSPTIDKFLIPIAGSGPASEISDEQPWENTAGEELSPEAKRELEKRLLLQEEERVATAAAKYKQEMANREPGGVSRHIASATRASTIQNKVKALLNENRAPTHRTAEGYGHYTDELYSQSQQQLHPHQQQSDTRDGKLEGRGIVSSVTLSREGSSQPVLKPRVMTSPSVMGGMIDQKVAKDSSNISPARPHPPPKPPKLRDLAPELSIRNTSAFLGDAGSADKDRRRSKEGESPTSTATSSIGKGGSGGMDLQDISFIGDPEEWQRNFAQRYPSLSGLEMVETVVGNGRKN